VNDSATDPHSTVPPSPRRHSFLVATVGIVLLLSGCAEEALPQRSLSIDDCLTNVKLDQLDEAIQRCDRVVAAFPGQPQPLNERFLLHWLKGDETAACRDIRKAARLDRQLRRDLELRLASCSEPPGPQARPQPAAAAPSAASPAR
jgi:hypothetical protein